MFQGRFQGRIPQVRNCCLFQEDRRKQEERDRKKAEVRKRLEEASKQKKAKKGFLTPERKKKLRVSSFFYSFNGFCGICYSFQDFLFFSDARIGRMSWECVKILLRQFAACFDR